MNFLRKYWMPILAYPAMVLIFSGLSGCGFTRYGDAARTVVKEAGKKAAAAGLQNTLWALCRATPIGAVRDRFMVGSDQWKAYAHICEIPYANVPVKSIPVERSELPDAR